MKKTATQSEWKKTALLLFLAGGILAGFGLVALVNSRLPSEYGTLTGASAKLFGALFLCAGAVLTVESICMWCKKR